jgi:hypothetical protein
MYFNKIYSSSTERIISRSPSTNTFDIELQHPQPRRRQTIDHNHENDINKEQYYGSPYSILTPKQQDGFASESDQFSSRDNVFTIPTNFPIITAPDPIIGPASPEVVEEK